MPRRASESEGRLVFQADDQGRLVRVDRPMVESVPASQVKVLRYEPVPARAPGQKLDGEPQEQAAEVVRRLAAAHAI